MFSVFLILFHLAGHAIEQTAALSSVQNTSSATFTVTDVDSLRRGAARLKWKAVPNASYYEVFTTRSANFSGAHKSRVIKNSLPVLAVVGETYYWRVVAYHKDGQRLSARAREAFTFTINYQNEKSAP